jgi:CBS domain-containing protein
MFVETVLRRRTHDVAVLPLTAKTAEAAQLLCQQHIQIVVICGPGGQIIGVVTDSDILRAVGHCPGDSGACRGDVADLMIRDVVTCSPGDSLDRVVSMMLKRGLRRVPVVEPDGRLAGLITMREALLYLYEEAKLDGELLREYFLGIGYH